MPFLQPYFLQLTSCRCSNRADCAQCVIQWQVIPHNPKNNHTQNKPAAFANIDLTHSANTRCIVYQYDGLDSIYS